MLPLYPCIFMSKAMTNWLKETEEKSASMAQQKAKQIESHNLRSKDCEQMPLNEVIGQHEASMVAYFG